jgi:hypothetical protein
MDLLETFELKSWEEDVSKSLAESAVEALEKGKVIYLPKLSFSLSEEEKKFLSPQWVDPKSKNISYSLQSDRLGGSTCHEAEALVLKALLKRYAISARQFLEKLFPCYTPFLIQAKTSLRPVEIYGRKSASWRKDDTRLHVDSFPANPTGGKRILRIFTNVNIEGKPRVWRLGEPFEEIAKKWGPKAASPIWGMAEFLKCFKITKGYRTSYDHYMLQIHDLMKEDLHYQQTVSQCEVQFPAGSSWIVFTDQAAHAAMSGKDVIEQTFELLPEGLKNVETHPLRVLEKILKRSLV